MGEGWVGWKGWVDAVDTADQVVCPAGQTDGHSSLDHTTAEQIFTGTV